MSIDPDVIHTEVHSEIGSRIISDVGILIQRWEKRATIEQPNAQSAYRDAMLDHLPAFLEQLGHSLRTSSNNGASHRRTASVHGVHRWQAGWSLGEVVRDYQILQLVLLEFLEESLERDLSYREVMAIGLAFDEAITTSVTSFVACRDQQLQNVEKSLREADHRKNEFLATLAHELRNPLAPLRTSVELLARVNITDPVVVKVREIFDRQVQQMTRLVDDLFDITRIAQGKMRLHPERIDLRAVLPRALQMCEPLMQSRRHQVDVQIPDEPIWLLADSARLVQVFSNLLNNAAKYTNPHGQIRLQAERSASAATVSVNDNGEGIRADLLPRIFDMFTQGDWSGDRAHGGLGIGLSLVRRIIELSGGSITAHSDGPGRGSTFTVTLPLSPD